MFAICVVAFQGCSLDSVTPPTYTGEELQAFAPAICSGSTSDSSFTENSVSFNYSNCGIDSCEHYQNSMEAQGWVVSSSEDFNLGGDELFKVSLTKTFSGRLVTMNVRCSDGWDSDYSTSLKLSD